MVFPHPKDKEFLPNAQPVLVLLYYLFPGNFKVRISGCYQEVFSGINLLKHSARVVTAEAKSVAQGHIHRLTYFTSYHIVQGR